MDQQRLLELIDRHAAALALYASQWTPAADDVVQEALIRLIDARPEPDRPVPWLYTVVRNLAISHLRSESRRKRRELLAARLTVDEVVGLSAVEIGEALERLDSDTCEVVVAHIWGGLSFAEIAELVGISSSAAHRRYQAGLAVLRKSLEQPCSNRAI